MSALINRFIQQFQLQLPPPSSATKQQRKAAVLVPIICRADPILLFTQRSSLLRKHAGQVSFPGGAADKTDGSLTVTALREANEEIGLNPDSVNIIGQLPPMDSISGFQVTPIVGLLPDGLQFRENKSEVAALFEVPLSYLLNLDNHYSIDITRRGKSSRIYFIYYGDHFIWGLTASIVHRLAIQVKKML
ncbi:MAG: CoA pyrophosphatase [Enterobacteriaceae bacterium]|jgi:8-oxo-dGTP pyrophosphatase MutT (NUDIX family)|nr:CoA pyrophosphatase [Enterobacteriaceae bacterium]